MNILNAVKHRARYIITAAVIAVSGFTPVLVSAAVSADQVTTRSIALSSSSANADNVTYEVTFTAPHAAGAFALLFCSNSPIPGVACSAPAGFNATAAASTTSGFTTVTGATNSAIVTGTIGTGATVTVDVTGIHNPTAAGPLYARISTYTDATAAGTDLAPTDSTQGVNGIDNGGVAMSISNTIGVSGAVLESMTFCVSGAVIGQDCGATRAPTPTSPVLSLGETVGDTKALQPTAISTGTLYAQISTNAASGAVINLKSSNDCGGLKRVGATVCDIAPVALTGGITAGQAKFGLLTGTVAASASDPDANGTIRPVGVYNPTTYALNYKSDNSTGVTSAIGDPFLDTNNKPVNNQNMDITFGASVSNSTPAGNYSTNLSMIATGKF